jgi:hypothetical protein
MRAPLTLVRGVVANVAADTRRARAGYAGARRSERRGVMRAPLTLVRGVEANVAADTLVVRGVEANVAADTLVVRGVEANVAADTLVVRGVVRTSRRIRSSFAVSRVAALSVRRRG